MGLLFVQLVFWARSGPVASAARPLSVPTKRAFYPQTAWGTVWVALQAIGWVGHFPIRFGCLFEFIGGGWGFVWVECASWRALVSQGRL